MSTPGPISSSTWLADLLESIQTTISEYLFEPVYNNVISPFIGSPLSPPPLQLAAPEPTPSVSPTLVPTSTPSPISPATHAPSTSPAQVPNFWIQDSNPINRFSSGNQSFISQSPTPSASSTPVTELPSRELAPYGASIPDGIEYQTNSTSWVTDGVEAMTYMGNTIINGTAYGVSETLKMGASLAENTTFTQSLADLLKAGATVVEEHPLATTCAVAATTTLAIVGLAYKKGYFSRNQNQAIEKTVPNPEGANNPPPAERRPAAN